MNGEIEEETELTEAVEYARRMFMERLLYEGAGLFWLGAEAVILFAVLGAREYLVSMAGDGARQAALGRRALVWSAVFLAGALGVEARHWLWPPMHRLLAEGTISDAEEARALYVFRVRLHLGVWAAFVAGWVLLEALIVYHGWRAYGLLRTLLARRGTLLLVLGLGLCAAGAEGRALINAVGVVDALREADAPDGPYRNAVYLWLRTAGVVWIGVEWVAAFLLWRCFRMISRAAAAAKAGEGG